jgi:hypothetical protein
MITNNEHLKFIDTLSLIFFVTPILPIIESPTSKFSTFLNVSFMTSLLSLMSSTESKRNNPTKPPMSSSRQLATLPLIILVRSPLNLKLLEYFHLISLFMKLIILSAHFLEKIHCHFHFLEVLFQGNGGPCIQNFEFFAILHLLESLTKATLMMPRSLPTLGSVSSKARKSL